MPECSGVSKEDLQLKGEGALDGWRCFLVGLRHGVLGSQKRPRREMGEQPGQCGEEQGRTRPVLKGRDASSRSPRGLTRPQQASLGRSSSVVGAGLAQVRPWFWSPTMTTPPPNRVKIRVLCLGGLGGMWFTKEGFHKNRF